LVFGEIIRYGTGSARRFQHSFRRQTGHKCRSLASRSSRVVAAVHQAAEGGAVVHGQDVAPFVGRRVLRPAPAAQPDPR
jgi:hypothetical protein